MTSKHHIYLVDVFTDRAYADNPLAVVAYSAACSTTETELEAYSCYVTLACLAAIAATASIHKQAC